MVLHLATSHREHHIRSGPDVVLLEVSLDWDAPHEMRHFPQCSYPALQLTSLAVHIVPLQPLQEVVLLVDGFITVSIR